MTETQNIEIAAATCGITTEHKAHRHFDAENVSRPCSALVTLAQLTSRMGLQPYQQQDVAAFVDGQGPWTEGQAAELVHIWEHTDPQTGMYRDPSGGWEAAITDGPTGLGDAPDVAAVAEADDELPAAELLAIVLDNARRYVPGGGEQFLDRYLAQTRAELAPLLDAYGETMGRAGIRLGLTNGSAESAAPFAKKADALKAEILKRFGGER